MLPLSHDEVVYGKGYIVNKMARDEWQKLANLRALYLFMYTFSGTKLVFMGGEFGQISEWNVNQSLDWHLMAFPPHKGLFEFFKKLNTTYKNEPALYEKAFSPEGFEWLELNDADNSILAYIRKGHDQHNDLVVVLNLTPVVRESYRVGVPTAGNWEIIFNSDDLDHFGSGVSIGHIQSEPIHWMYRDNSINLKLPPLGGVILKMTT